MPAKALASHASWKFTAGRKLTFWGNRGGWGGGFNGGGFNGGGYNDRGYNGGNFNGGGYNGGGSDAAAAGGSSLSARLHSAHGCMSSMMFVKTRFSLAKDVLMMG
jgi:hypothetical protein